MHGKAYNIILLVILAAGLLSSFLELKQRTQAESEYRTVTIAIDYFQLNRFARHNGIEIGSLLNILKAEGLDTLALIEDTPEFLEERGIASVVKGFNVVEKVPSGPMAKKKKEKDKITEVTEGKLVAGTLGLSPNEVHVIFRDDFEYANDLYHAWKNRIGDSRIRYKHLETEELFIVTLDGDPEIMYQLGAGFITPLHHELTNSGFTILPRFRNNRFIKPSNPDLILQSPEPLSFTGRDLPVIFDGDEVFGYPSAIKETGDLLKENNLIFGYVEFAKQAGDINLGRYMIPDVVRIHSISDEEMEIYTPAQALNRFMRAVRERNVRVVFLKPFFIPSQGHDLVQTNINFFKSVRDRISSQGYKTGKIRVLKKQSPDPFTKALILISTGSAFLLLLSWGWKIRSFILALIIILASLLIATKSPESVHIKVWGLIAGLTFPCLGIAYLFSTWEQKGRFLSTIAAFAVTFLLTFTGAMIVAALFSTESYMQEMQSFSGVKISFVIPIFLVALIGVRLYFRKGKSGFIKELAFLGDLEIKVKHLAFLAIVAFAGLILLTRSGNEPLFGVSEMENTLRGAMEGFFSVRPRTKEFLIGHPLLILSFFALYRYPVKLDSLAFVCLIGGMIGQVSMFNTFCHFHTPMGISVIRTFYGLLAGIVGGILLILLLMVILKFLNKSAQN